MRKLRNNLEGKTFKRLKVLYRHGTGSFKAVLYRCLCDCGKQCTVRYGGLVRGSTQSCGCLKRERAQTHGYGRPIYYYKLWIRINKRCYDPKYHSYLYYGGRGLHVHKKWRHTFGPFYDYLRDSLGWRPSKKYSLDRIDNNKGYIPGNLRWASASKQSYNRRFPNSKKKYQGVYPVSKTTYLAKICINYKEVRLGIFKTEIEAVRAYNKKALELHGVLPDRNILDD